jgi:hypothetical protein
MGLIMTATTYTDNDMAEQNFTDILAAHDRLHAENGRIRIQNKIIERKLSIAINALEYEYKENDSEHAGEALKEIEKVK